MASKEDKLMIPSLLTGMLSLAGSSLLICTILRSKKKLRVPYRRIIFGTSVFDVFQSSGLTTSIFLSPKNMDPPKKLAIGNNTTCDIQGFFTTIGAIGVPLYLCSLSIYYFCIIRLNMRNHHFMKIEPYLHGVPIVYSLFCGIYAWVFHYYNNAGSVCYVAPAPITCEILPDVECTRGEGASSFRLRFLSYPSMAIFIVVCSVMAIITYTVKKTELRQRRYLFPRSCQHSLSESSVDGQVEESNEQQKGRGIINVLFHSRSQPSAITDPKDDDNTIPAEVNSSSSSPHFQPSTVLNQRRSSYSARKSRRSTDRTGEIMKQALLYVGSYVLSYGFVWAQSIYMLATKLPPPVILRILSSIFFPLQGFVNIFIYCRPHIVTLRRDGPGEYTWLQAFVMVLKSGGDDPLTPQERRLATIRRASIRNASSNLNIKGRESSFTKAIEMDNSDLDSNDSIARLLLKAEMCEKRSSITSRTDLENQSQEESFGGLSHHFKPNKKSESFECDGTEEAICDIPIADLEAMTNAMIEVSSDDGSSKCTGLDLSKEDFPSSNFDEPKDIVWDGADPSDPTTTAEWNRSMPKEQHLWSNSVGDYASAGVINNNNNQSDDDGSDAKGKGTRETSEDESTDDSIPESLENFIHDAEQMIENTMGEFLSIAGKEEKDEGNHDDNIEGTNLPMDTDARNTTSWDHIVFNETIRRSGRDETVGTDTNYDVADATSQQQNDGSIENAGKR